MASDVSEAPLIRVRIPMSLQQVTLGLMLAWALSSYTLCAWTPKHVLFQSREPGIDEDERLVKLPETSFKLSTTSWAKKLKEIFTTISKHDSKFKQLYKCNKDLQAVEFISYRLTIPRSKEWMRIIYRVIINQPNGIEDMLFIEVFTPDLSCRARLMAMRNRMSPDDPLPERVEHFINGCPARRVTSHSVG